MIIVSKAQGRALEKLMALYESAPHHPDATARMLKESLSTLRVLFDMGFVARRDHYKGFSPRDDSYWRITEAGREAFPHVDALP